MTNKGSGALGPLRRTITVLSAWCCSTASLAWDRGRRSAAAPLLTPSPASSPQPASGRPTPETGGSNLSICLSCQFCVFFMNLLQTHFTAGLFGHPLCEGGIYSPMNDYFKVQNVQKLLPTEWRSFSPASRASVKFPPSFFFSFSWNEILNPVLSGCLGSISIKAALCSF